MDNSHAADSSRMSLFGTPATTFSRPFKDQSGAWHNGTSFGLNDLEAKEWIASSSIELCSGG